MDFSAFVPSWLDAFLIAPFRWPANPIAGMWLGSSLLSLYASFIGEAIGAGLFFLHHRYYTSMQDDMIRYHNISVQALHSGNKEAYLAANSIAQDSFGKSFFAQATIGIASLLPLPFALAWMAQRFEGIELYRIPGTSIHAGYVFVVLTTYIVCRILVARYKKRLPLFRRIESIRRQAREARGPVRSFFNPE